MPNGIQQYVKLEARLVLLTWLNSLLSFERNCDLLADIKETAEGFDAEGHSFIYHHLTGRGDKVKISRDDLERYDDNIRNHLQAINACRKEPITLRYFQYMAALYTEIFLDYYFHRRAEILRVLNLFVAERNKKRLSSEPQETLFTEQDLKKIAYWMATGSGKTLIMHLNYYQFLFYNTASLDNILLITPNEGLTQQHLEELAASGIPARCFNLNETCLDIASKNIVRIIEITKLVEQKRGGGVSVPVEAFEGNNLIFVDEGHKGSGGEAWRKYRDALAQTGFTFEYSATFGQALSAARNDALTAEYGKAIIFDYSYRYFHGDGYGKDFRVLNLKQETTEEQTELLLLGNLLSFYEQQRLFEEQANALNAYHLEPPLWIFVGSTVNAVYCEDKQKRSDVLTVARFLHHVLENKRGWVVKSLEKLLVGKTGLMTPDGVDVFAGKFNYLCEQGLTAEKAYQEILSRVLHAPGSGGLHLCDIRGRTGEIGLKGSGAKDYFGLIYIGDTSAFKKLAEEDDSGIILEEDAIANSLFDSISRKGSSIEILIGAKKFMEGWNSWRVSTMGLLNIGKREGSQIIQLFGRGVRLRGKDMSLKRSAALPGAHPANINILEMLNIFAVRADYMQQFREYLEKEGVETEEAIEMPIFTQINKNFLKKELIIPRLPENSSFSKETVLLLECDEAAQVSVDMSLKIETIQSSLAGVTTTAGQAGNERKIPDENLSLIDWESAYLNLLEYKERKNFVNLVIPHDIPMQIITCKSSQNSRLYRLIADEEVVQPTSFNGRKRLQEAVTNILRKYIDKFYRVRREQWESNHMEYRILDENDPNLAFNRQVVKEGKATYFVHVQRSKKDLVSAIQKLIADAEKLYNEENNNLPRIYFDRHLYLPLLLQKTDDSPKSIPPALTDSEAQFVLDLKKYWAQEKDKSLQGKEVFLLRNLSRGAGLGFFEERGFYPDFILWIIERNCQHIVFIEPHGMAYASPYANDNKAQLHEELPLMAKEIAVRNKVRKQITLDSYLICPTPYDDLCKRYDDGKWDRQKFAAAHILFLERKDKYDYIEIIFREQIANACI